MIYASYLIIVYSVTDEDYFSDFPVDIWVESFMVYVCFSWVTDSSIMVQILVFFVFGYRNV